MTNLQSEFLPIINEVNSQVIYLDEQDLVYKISNYSSLKSELQRLSEESNHYIYNEDDRQDVKKFKAEINKFEKAFKSKIKEEENALFGEVNNDKKEIVQLLNSIKSNVEQGIIDEDNRYRIAKEEKLEQSFEEAKQAYEYIKDTNFKYSDLSKKNWLNRSMSEDKATAEMNERVSTVDSILKELTEMKRRESTSKDLILNILNKKKWNSLNALNELKTHFDEEDARLERAIKEKEEREKREQERIEKKYEEEQVVETASLIIAKKDLSRVKATLNRLNISYELGD